MKKIHNLLAILIVGLISIGSFSPCMAANQKKDKVKKVRVRYIPDIEVKVPIANKDVFLQLDEGETFNYYDHTQKSYIVSRQAIWRLKTRYIQYRGMVPYAKSGAEANMSEELYQAVCKYHKDRYDKSAKYLEHIGL